MMLVAMTQVAGYERNRDGAQEYPEPDVENASQAPGQAPLRYDFPRQPFEGLRAVVSNLVHHVMPGVPLGPQSIVAQRAPDARPGKRAVNPTRAASVYVPVPGIEQTAPWYDYAAPDLL